MARVEKPLSFIELMSSHSREALNLLSTYHAVDSKGRYLHWNEFKRRVPAGVNRIAAWAAIKMARSLVLKRTELSSESGEPFNLMVPDSCQHIIHQVEHLSAEIGANRESTTQLENSRYLVDSLMMEEAISVQPLSK